MTDCSVLLIYVCKCIFLLTYDCEIRILWVVIQTEVYNGIKKGTGRL